MKVTAVIFDLDGTILDDEDDYAYAFRKVLKDLGVDESDKYPHKTGIGVKENWQILLNKYNLITDKSPDQLAGQTQKVFLSRIPKIKIREGFFQLISRLRQENIKIALATSNNKYVLDVILAEQQLENIFDVIISRDEVIHNKPDPELLILAAKRLGENVNNCIAVDDSQSGIVAAHAAGMKVVGFIKEKELSDEMNEADIKIFNFSDLTLDKVRSL